MMATVVTYLPPTGTPETLAAIGYDGRTWDRPWNLARGQITTAERMPSVELDPGGPPHPLPVGATLDVAGLTFADPLGDRPLTGGQFLDRRLFSDALAVVHDGRLVHESYRNGVTEADRHVVHSCSKTLTTMMVGIAIDEGRLDPSLPMSTYVPELAAIPAWGPITLQHVLDMATGLDLEEHYELPDSMYWRYADAVGYYTTPAERQIGTLAFAVAELVRTAEPPGTRFNYGSYLTNLLPIAIANAYGEPAVELYEQRIYRHLGAERPALVNVDAVGNPIVEGQVNLTLRDFVRWGLLLVDGGRSLAGTQVIPPRWVEDTANPPAESAAAFARGDHGDAFAGAAYRNQTWVLEPGRVVTMLGIHGQFCWVDLESRTLIAGFSSYPDQANELMTATLQKLWSTIRGALAD